MDRLANELAATCRYVPKFDWATVGPPTWTPLPKQVSDLRVVFATSGGFYLRDEQEPFDQDPTHTDASLRLIPVDVDPGRLGISHRFYDRSFAQVDLECMVPLRTLGQLVGSPAERWVSFMGYLPEWDRIEAELGPAMLEAVRGLGGEAVLLSPG